MKLFLSSCRALFTCILAATTLYVAAALLDSRTTGGILAARADDGWVPPHPVERRLPDARDLRPLNVPVAPSRDSGQRLIERSKLNNERRRLEQRRDPHDFRSQNRLRRLDRGIDRLR